MKILAGLSDAELYLLSTILEEWGDHQDAGDDSGDDLSGLSEMGWEMVRKINTQINDTLSFNGLTEVRIKTIKELIYTPERNE